MHDAGALARLQTTASPVGTMILPAETLTQWGKPIFNVLVARREFAEEHGQYLRSFVQLFASIDANYIDHTRDWVEGSLMLTGVQKLVPAASPETLRQLAPSFLCASLSQVYVCSDFVFISLEEQLSCTWLGCGNLSGFRMAQRLTEEFMHEQKAISGVSQAYRNNYEHVVRPEYLQWTRDNGLLTLQGLQSKPYPLLFFEVCA